MFRVTAILFLSVALLHAQLIYEPVPGDRGYEYPKLPWDGVTMMMPKWIGYHQTFSFTSYFKGKQSTFSSGDMVLRFKSITDISKTRWFPFGMSGFFYVEVQKLDDYQTDYDIQLIKDGKDNLFLSIKPIQPIKYFPQTLLVRVWTPGTMPTIMVPNVGSRYSDDPQTPLPTEWLLHRGMKR